VAQLQLRPFAKVKSDWHMTWLSYSLLLMQVNTRKIERDFLLKLQDPVYLIHFCSTDCITWKEDKTSEIGYVQMHCDRYK
jgi:hypothetical protein